MKRLVVLSAVSALLLSCASGSKSKTSTTATGANAPRYTAEPGDNPVGVIPAGSIRDTQRNKDIEVSIDYPTKTGPFPVIIFSHGLGSSPREYTGLAAYWASHGYIVIRPAHADARRTGQAEAGVEELERQAPADWRGRTRDIVAVIDSLTTTLPQVYPELAGKIDANKVGVGGYSYGAFTTMLLAGTRTFLDPKAPVSYSDPRIKAAVALSPQGPGERRGLTTESWANVKIPALFMTGSADVGAGQAENPEWRRQAFELSPAGDKWFVLLEGAGHSTFAGRSTAPIDQVDPRDTRPPLMADPRDPTGQNTRQPVQPRNRNSAGFERDRMLFRGVQSITLAFWDNYLKGETAGKDYLTKLSNRSDLQMAMK